jgi:hypothetical protein
MSGRMTPRQRFVWIAVALCALFCTACGEAAASPSEQSLLMDDRHLIYSGPAEAASTIQQLKALGVDRIKVSIVWSLVAPNQNSHQVPHFDAANPAAYPAGRWARWDLLVELAKQVGMGVYFQITPPAPAWAVARGKPTQGYTWSYKPSASQFGKFVEAIGRRYSGSYTPPGAAGPLPRVSFWGIWNEANEGAWLNPQWSGNGAHRTVIAPAMYRGLLDAAWRGFAATGHSHDTILTGELASSGWIYPIPFVNAMYCVGSNGRPLSGAAARAAECPTNGSRSAFTAQHPGLFATEFAHHPYSFDVPPNKVLRSGDVQNADTGHTKPITMANLDGLEHALNRIFSTYGKSRSVPMYLTEYGYKSNPPNPFVHTSLSEQATWVNQGEYMSWHDGYVHALAQFLLYDDKPRAGAKPGTRAYWSTFQSGLLYVDGKPKPALDAYRLPIWLINPSHANLQVWGQLRPGNHSATQTAKLQFQARGSQGWTTVDTINTNSSEGFFTDHPNVSGAGLLRIAWQDPSSQTTYYSRSASVS